MEDPDHKARREPIDAYTSRQQRQQALLSAFAAAADHAGQPKATAGNSLVNEVSYKAVRIEFDDRRSGQRMPPENCGPEAGSTERKAAFDQVKSEGTQAAPMTKAEPGITDITRIVIEESGSWEKLDI
jgi:hypothetical protein